MKNYAKILVILFPFFLIASLSWAVPVTWVDDDFNSGTPGWKVTHFDNITTGIYNVDPGGTVNVAAGNYTEDILIDKPLILDGESSETVILQPVGVQLDLYFWAPTHILITSSDVVVQNVQLSGNESICDEGVFIEDSDNVTIQHCNIHNYNSDAIYCLDAIGTNNLNINILNNNIHHIRENNNNIGWNTTMICLENTGGTIADNVLTSSSVRYGIMNWIDAGFANLPSPPVLSGNTIENLFEPRIGGNLKFNVAIVLGDPATITDNIIRNSNYGIQAQLSVGGSAYDGDILIQSNELYDLRPSVDPVSLISRGIYLNAITTQPTRNVLIEDNIIDGINGNPALSSGLYVWNATDGTITWRNNQVNGYGIGAEFRQNQTTTLFENNTLNLDALIASTIPNDMGLLLNNTSALTCSECNISGFDYGVLIDTNSSLDLDGSLISASGTGIRVINGGNLNSAVENIISAVSGDGILVETDVTAGVVGSIFNNDLSNFGTLAVNNTMGVDIDVSGNWFGVSAPGDIPSAVSANVDYTPWLVYDTDTSGNPGFQGDFSELRVDDDSPQTGAEPYIGEALAMADFPAAIQVYAGNYTEGLDIDQSLSLIGPDGAASTTIDGTGSGRPSTSGLDISIAIKPASDSLVVVDGFNIINCDVGVEIKDTGGNAGDHLTLQNCTFNNVDINGTAVVVEHSRADIQYNDINGIGAGIRIANSSNSNIQYNNIFNGNHYGIIITDDNMEGLGALTCENVNVVSNTIGNLTSLPGSPAYGIYMGWTDPGNPGAAPFGKNNTVSDNTVTTCGHTGIVFDAQNDVGDGQLLIDNNTVEDCGKFAGVTEDGMQSLGVYGTSYGVVFSNNKIRNNADRGLFINNAQVRCDNNTITNNDIGVVLNSGIVDLGYGPYASVGLNHIENNATLNLWNISADDMKAENNWWGSIVFATVETSIDHEPDNVAQGFVDFIPFKGITDPDPVWVDRTYGTGTAGWGYDHFDNIREGVLAVLANGTVNVADGTYDTETYPIIINKGLHLSGASPGAIIRDPASSVNSQLGTGTVFFNISSDNVSITSLTIDGDNDPSTADDASIPERGHGDANPANDVNALTGIRVDPSAAETSDNLYLGNILFENLYRGVVVSGRPGQADELSLNNKIENCVFENIGARNQIFKSGAGIYFTSAEVEITTNTFTNCDSGILGEILPGSSVVAALSVYDNLFSDNYFGLFIDGTKSTDAASGITTFDPDGAGPIVEGIYNNLFDTTSLFRNDTDGWNLAAGDFIDHFNLDAAASGPFNDPTPPTSDPDTPVGFFVIAGTDPMLLTENQFNNLRRGAMVCSERGETSDDATITLLSNNLVGPGTDTGFDSVPVLAANRRTYGDAQAEDDFGGDVKINLYDNYLEGGVDLIRLREEPVSVLDPTTFYVLLGGSVANKNIFGLTRNQAINLGIFNISGGGMRDDVDATYNDFLVNRYYQVEDTIYHKNDDATLGLVTFLPAARLADLVNLVANPNPVNNYNVTVDLTATISDPFGSPIGDMIPVNFSTDMGSLGTPNPVSTFGGQAVNTLLSDQEGTAMVTAAVDGIATSTIPVVFDISGLETIAFYPYNNPDFEGWRESNPPPGTYIPDPLTPFYMAPLSQPTGEVGILDNYNVNLFGFWETKPEYALPYLPNKVYRARYRLRTDQPDQSKVPMIRMRWSNSRFLAVGSQHINGGHQSPVTTGATDYYSYYYPPDLSGLPSSEATLLLYFDLVDFSLNQMGSVFLEEIEVERFNVPPRSIATPVMTHNIASGLPLWKPLTIPTVFGAATVGSDATGLYLESKATPTPPAGLSGYPDYGAWELHTGESTVNFEPNHLYRAVFTLNVPDAVTQSTLARVRLRLHNGSSEWHNVYELFPLGPLEYYNHMPSVAGTEYSVFMESPMYFYSGLEDFKNRIITAIDLVDGKTTEYGRCYLTKVDVEYYDIP